MLPMRNQDIENIGAWIIERGLRGDTETALLQGFCQRCLSAGLELAQALLMVDTLHPIYEGRTFSWKKDSIDDPKSTEYESSRGGDGARLWQASPFFHLLNTGGGELRRRIGNGYPCDFTILEDLRSQGQTDYFALIHRFDEGTTIGEMDCVCSRWSTAAPAGFRDEDLDALRRLVPALGLAVKAYSLNRVAESLVEAYLGRDAGRRVLQGNMSRGLADRISAVLWFSDLRGYTSISESSAVEQILPFLNDYAEIVISAVQEAGGDVLKLMGDGTLAVFNAADPAEAASSALRAEADLRQRLAAMNQKREADGQPVTSVYLGLHFGDVFFGNIGSRNRLDFTVIGPAVNEVSRISGMCRSVDRRVLMSSEFVAALPQPEKSRLVSVGRYALRGVSRPQELFTNDVETEKLSLGSSAQQRG
jgi:adenylate cyclase